MELQQAQQLVDDWIKSHGVRYFNGKWLSFLTSCKYSKMI